MRSGKPTLRDSFFVWLGKPVPPDAADTQETLQQIRDRMMDALIDDPSAAAARLMGRILHADDALALWYCRSDLMQALSHRLGEATARAVVADITGLFDGLVPPSMLSARPGLRRR